MKRATSLAVVLILVLLAVLSGCSSGAKKPESAPAAEEVRIGVYLPMTGQMAAGGQMEWEGIQLAHELAPEVLGKPVKLSLVDNKSDKVEAANAVSRLIENDKVHLILGSYGSSLSMAGGPIAEKAKIPVVGTSCTNPLVTKGLDYYFRVCFIDPFQGTVMAKYAYNTLGIKKVGVIQDVAQDYSVGLSNYFRETWIKLSGDPASIVALTSYQTGDQDFTAQLTYVASKKPDAIFAPGYYGDVALLIKQARQLRINVPFLGGDAWEAPEFLQIGGAAVEGALFSTHYSAEAPGTEESKKFVEAYRKKYGKEPNAFAALGYDTYMFALDAIKRAGKVDPVAIRDAMAATKGFKGATGTINIDENGDAVKSAVILKVEAGKFKYVATVEPD